MKQFAGFALFSLQLLAADYTTYIGGSYPLVSSADDVEVAAMTTDASGNTYLTGGLSTDRLHNIRIPSWIAFVAKLDPAGRIVFSKALDGNGSQQGTAVAVDPSGNIYVAGNTYSSNLPLTHALQTEQSSIFILKLSPDGRTVLYLTYFGGSGGAAGSVAALATDAQGNLYLTGTTSASDFPTTPGIPTTIPNPLLDFLLQGAFITEISAAGDRILYSGIVAGSTIPCLPPPQPSSTSCFDDAAITSGVAIAVDASGNAYVAGNTNTSDLPTTPGALASQGIGAFVVKINVGGAGIAYPNLHRPRQVL